MNDEMQRYIGTKIINATEMTLGDYNQLRGWEMPKDEDAKRPGYLVVYPDGYKSWSPKEAFEEAYRITDNINFGLALEAMKKGKKVARNGWNGKDMYVFKTNYPPNSTHHGGTGDKQFPLLDSLCMKTINSSGRVAVLIGWLASQTDMLNDDWFIVEE